MSNPTRCVPTIDQAGEVCLWIDVQGDGTACTSATYKGQVCQSCNYVAEAQEENLCTTTTAGYALNCQNAASHLRDMTLCGEQLSATMAGGSSDGGGVNMGALVFFVLLLVFSLSVRVYAEVRRCREGLQDKAATTTASAGEEGTKETKELDEEGPIGGDVEFGNIEFPTAEFGNVAAAKTSSSSFSNNNNKKKQSSIPEEPLRKSSSSNSGINKNKPNNDTLTDNDNGGKRMINNKKRSTSKEPPKKQNSTKETKKQPQSSNKKLSKTPTTSSAKKKNTTTGNTAAATPPAAASEYVPPPPHEDDSASMLSLSALPGDKFEAYNEIKGDPKAAALRKYHRKGDWEAICSFFGKIRKRIIERQHYIALLVQWIAADWPGPVKKDTVYCQYLDAWNEAEPDNLQCNVIRLEVWIAWAWHGRTTAFAHEISPERVELFYDRMDRAAEELKRVLKITKKRDALVYAAAIKIATGRNDEQALVQQYMEAVQTSNDPANYNFHTRAMEYFCEKWHGSHKEMMDYANWITTQLPDGHPLWILIPVAHYERAALIEDAGTRLAYWHKQHDSIVEAYEKALGGPWETNINQEVSPACQKLDAAVRNWFVYALGKCRASELAQRQARVIGKRPLAELPWDEKNTYIKYVKALGFVVESNAVV